MLFSTEQVSKYHPDKLADQISDSLVAVALKKNPNARCAIETLVKDETVVVAGEIGEAFIYDYEVLGTARDVAAKLGYKVKDVINLLNTQSAQINQAVDQKDGDIGAGDQGMMVGFATRETKSFLPFAFDLANEIIVRIEKHTAEDKVLKGDAKTQVTVDISTNTVKKVLVSVCHNEDYPLEYVKGYIKTILFDIVQPHLLLINPAGKWTLGGPNADSGLTGRKIVADQYGGYTPVGGGAFSGKDLSKVDRSGAYAARNIAIDVLKEFTDIKTVEIQFAYAIGVAKPMSVNVKTTYNDDVHIAVTSINDDIATWIYKNYDLTPKALIKRLDLKPDDYPKLASGCHFKNGYVGNW